MKRLSLLLMLVFAGITQAQTTVSLKNVSVVETLNPATGYHLLHPHVDYLCTTSQGCWVTAEWKLTTEPATSYTEFAGSWYPVAADWTRIAPPPYGPVPLGYWPDAGVTIHVRIKIIGITTTGYIGPVHKVITYTIKL